jgi:hypothetical protein
MNVKPTISALNAHRAGATRDADRLQLNAQKMKAAQKTPATVSEKLAVDRPGRLDPNVLRHPVAKTKAPVEEAPVSYPPLSVEGLREAWGDFNSDGTVDAMDMLELLARLGAGETNSLSPAIDANDPVDVTETTVPLPPDPADPDVSDLTVEGLYKAWGTDSTEYDLNQDGIVDSLDLLALLERQGPGAQTEPSTLLTDAQSADTVDAGDGGPIELSVAGLRDAWGTDDPNYDLNGDGTVDALDMLALLARLGEQSTPEANNLFAQGNTPIAGGESAEDGEQLPLSIEGLREAWGSDDPRYDFNGDGTVDSLDLLAFLARMRGEQEEANAPSRVQADLAGDGAHAGERVGDRTASIAATIGEQLKTAGFDAQPPTNLHEILERFELPKPAQKSVLQHLAAQYPFGLGVNEIA